MRDSRMSHVDQDAVRRRTEKYARQDPNGHYHFQASGTNSKFMVVYQTAEQRRMLRLYGRDIIMLDATYKTQQWGLPLFNILVRDNHRKGYPVATFVLEDEKGETIEAALRLVKQWAGEDYAPAHVMVDYCQAEINAAEAVWPTRAILCKFHRMQAWSRWLDNGKNDVTPAG